MSAEHRAWLERVPLPLGLVIMLLGFPIMLAYTVFVAGKWAWTRWRLRLLFVGLLLLPRAAHAEPAPWIWAATCTIDWSTTYYGVTKHGPEGLAVGQTYVGETNPTISWLRETPTLMVGVGAAIDVGTWAALRKLDRRHHKITTALYYGMSAYRSYLVVKTLRAIHQADAPIHSGVFLPN